MKNKFKKCLITVISTAIITSISSICVFADDDMIPAAEAAVTGFMIAHPVIEQVVEHIQRELEMVIHVYESAREVSHAVVEKVQEIRQVYQIRKINFQPAHN